MRSAALRSLPLVLALAAVAACNPQTTPPATQPSGVTTAPLATATPVATASPTPSTAPSTSTTPSDLPSSGPSASSSPSLPPGVLFREDFDGTELDPERWTVYEKNGLVRVKDGHLDMLNAGPARDFPLAIVNGDVFPGEGPAYLELSYTSKLVGRSAGFQLDFLPPEAANTDGLTVPFMQSLWTDFNLVERFNVETPGTFQIFARGNLKPDVPFRLRVERDADNNWRGILNDTEYTSFKSKRQPRRFWIGDSPNKPLSGIVTWSRMTVDYVEIGILSEPDRALPVATPTPKPAS